MDMTLSQQIMLVNTFVARTTTDPALLAPAIRSAVAEVDSTQVITNVRTVEEYAAEQLRSLHAYTTVLVAFGLASVTLAVIGLHGILAHLVAQRRRELGIRMALGARPASVIGLVVRHGLLMILGGIAIGTAAALGLTRLLETLLWGVTATDPLTFALVLLAFAVFGVATSLLSARRATRIDPLMVLRD
jgi:ABC-type antimicrobial peptide transport system permease subunit